MSREIAYFTNGTQKFWVKNPKKLKWWRALTHFPLSTVRELKSKTIQ